MNCIISYLFLIRGSETSEVKFIVVVIIHYYSSARSLSGGGLGMRLILSTYRWASDSGASCIYCKAMTRRDSSLVHAILSSPSHGKGFQGVGLIESLKGYGY